jgi:hypothetical protein
MVPARLRQARIHEVSTPRQFTLSGCAGSTRLARRAREGSEQVPDADDIAEPEADAVPGPDETVAPEVEITPAVEETAAPEAVAEADDAGTDDAPPPAPVPESADAALVEAVSGGLTWIPFACYLGLWIVLAGLSAYLLYGATADQPARWMPEYVPLLWSGVGLTALGPVLSVTVWLVARARRPKSERRGLFASAMTRGALVAFFGVAIWVATLFVLEIVAVGGTL